MDTDKFRDGAVEPRRLRKRPQAGLATRKAPPGTTRAGEVLNLVRRGRARTTSELARALGLARSTVTERVETLLQLGLLVPDGETSDGRGRPAGALAFNARAGITLVAHVGMIGTFLALTDLSGDVLWFTQVQMDVSEGPDILFKLLRDTFISAMDELGLSESKIYGIGVGLPGDIEIATGRSNAATAMHRWADYPFADQFERTFGAPTYVDRDVNLMALGERLSSWPSADVFVCLKVGTVIACGVVVGNQVIRGASGLVGEIGHTKVPGNDKPCSCGSRGCLNTVASGAALAAWLEEHGQSAHSARDVAALANSGVALAGQAIRDAGLQVGQVMASVVNLLNPDVITVWGYLVDLGDQFLAGMQEAIYKGALPTSARATTIAPVRQGDQAGLRGAALSVIESALAPEAIDDILLEYDASRPAS